MRVAVDGGDMRTLAMNPVSVLYMHYIARALKRLCVLSFAFWLPANRLLFSSKSPARVSPPTHPT